jgi:high-affinity nickel-transport protein
MKSQVFSGSFRNRVTGFFAFLGFLNGGTWIWAILAFRDKPVLLGTALLAYTFGLRHAVDADHIAAIDNVTRKLVQEGQRPASVGFFFALGHSTIVVIAALIIYASVSTLGKQLDVIREVGSVAGTWISVFFLISIAMINLVILRGVWRTFRKVREGEDYSDQSPDLLLGGGIFGRMFRPLFRLLRSPCHMYPIGLPFGLGFDTTTEGAARDGRVNKNRAYGGLHISA